MSNLKNPRAFSLEDEFMNYKVNDLVYGFMRGLSTVRPPIEGQDEYREYLPINIFSKRKKLIAGIVGVTTKQIGNIVNQLANQGLIDEGIEVLNGKDIKVFYFPPVEGRFETIEQDMVRFLVNTGNKFSIKIYIYLLNKYKWKRKTNEKYLFTIEELRLALGFAETTQSSDYLIKDILHLFKLAGLIDYQVVAVEVPNSNFAGSRTFKMRLDKVCEKYYDLDASGFEDLFN